MVLPPFSYTVRLLFSTRTEKFRPYLGTILLVARLIVCPESEKLERTALRNMVTCLIAE
jgi:hypothetical protein